MAAAARTARSMGSPWAGTTGRSGRARMLRAGLACLLCGPALVWAQVDLSFEQTGAGSDRRSGWDWADAGQAVDIDGTIAAQGSRSLRIRRQDAEGTTRVTQRFAAPALSGNRIRITAKLRTRAVEGAAGLWIRIDADGGLLYVDGTRAHGIHGDSDWVELDLEAPQFAQAATITVGAELRGRGTAWFDDFKIAASSTAQDQPPGARAGAYLDEALAVLERHAWRRAQIDWPVLRATARAQAAGADRPEDAYLAVRYALGMLGDYHSYLMTPAQVASLEAEPVANARTRRPLRLPRAELLTGSIAYLWLPGFAGGPHAAQVEFAERVQSLIAGLDAEASCGWVLDLRANQGGNLWPMLAGVGPLLGAGAAGAAVYPDGRSQSVWYEDGRVGLGDFVQLRVPDPYPAREPQKGVAVLIGGATASSAETLVLAFESRPWARSFGTATRGLTTVNRSFGLSDGSALVLAVAASRGPEGRVITGALWPQHPVDEPAPLTERLSSQPSVRAAVEWLAAASPGCAAGPRDSDAL